MKDHLVATVPEPIMRVQHRLVLICVKAPALHFFCAQQPTKLGDPLTPPARPLSLHCLRQSAIAQEEVVAGKRRDLVLRQFTAGSIRRFCEWFARLRAGLSTGSRHNALIMN